LKRINEQDHKKNTSAKIERSQPCRTQCFLQVLKIEGQCDPSWQNRGVGGAVSISGGPTTNIRNPNQRNSIIFMLLIISNKVIFKIYSFIVVLLVLINI